MNKVIEHKDGEDEADFLNVSKRLNWWDKMSYWIWKWWGVERSPGQLDATDVCVSVGGRHRSQGRACNGYCKTLHCLQDGGHYFPRSNGRWQLTEESSLAQGSCFAQGYIPPPCQGKPIFHDWLIRDTKTRSPFLNSGKLWRAIPAPELLKTTEALLCPGHTSASPGAESRFPRWPPGAAPWSTPQKTYTQILFLRGPDLRQRGWYSGFCFFFFNVLRFRCCAGFSVVAASRGYSLVAVRGLFIAVPSLVVAHRL